MDNFSGLSAIRTNVLRSIDPSDPVRSQEATVGRVVLTLTLVVTAALLAGCGGSAAGDLPQEPPGVLDTTTDTDADVATDPPTAPSEAPTPAPTIDEKAIEAATRADLTAAPGPAADDPQRAADNARAAAPTDPSSWAATVIAQTHGDYAAHTREILAFTARIATTSGPEAGSSSRAPDVGTNHVAIVLDSSGSMAAASGRRTRMAQAKAAISDFSKRLPERSTVSLRVYGDAGSNATADKAASCASTRVAYRGAPGGVTAALDGVRPVGWTPLAAGVRAAATDIPKPATDAIVYVVSDGVETCGGDPIGAVKALSAAGVKPIVNVIGFEVGRADTAQLRAMARAGGGEFVDARRPEDLTDYWRRDAERMAAAWNAWRDAELASITTQGEQLRVEAIRSPNAILAGLDQEETRQRQVVELLSSSGSLDAETRTSVEAILQLRHNGLRSWAMSARDTNSSDAMSLANTEWSRIYQTANSRWSQHYQRAQERP